MKKLLLTLVGALVLTVVSAVAGENKEKCCCGMDKSACSHCSNKDKPCEQCAKMEKDSEKKKT